VASRRKDRCIDSLRLSQREQQELIARLEAAAAGHRGANLRTEDRLPCHAATCAVATLHHPGGSVANYLVRPRNLSRHGIGFLNGNFVHIGSRCQIHLLRLDKRAQAVSGTVVRCQHVDGLVHEIGVRFDEPIELADFLTSQTQALMTAACDASEGQTVEVPSLSGRVLYMDRSTDDQELLRLNLQQLGVELFAASDALTAVDILNHQSVDLIITELSVPGLTAPEFVDLLRAGGYSGPIIALASEAGAEAGPAVPRETFADVFFKPFTLEHLVEWLTPYLGAAGQKEDEAPAACLASTEWHDLQMRPRILGFLGQIEAQVRKLAELVQAGRDVPLLQRLSRELAVAADGHGYAQVSTVAFNLHELAGQGASPEALADRCRELAELARRACLIQREGEA
jgi:CheY-like chemotaxis protein